MPVNIFISFNEEKRSRSNGSEIYIYILIIFGEKLGAEKAYFDIIIVL